MKSTCDAVGMHHTMIPCRNKMQITQTTIKQSRNFPKYSKRSARHACNYIMLCFFLLSCLCFIGSCEGSPKRHFYAKHKCLRHCDMCTQMYGDYNSEHNGHFLADLCAIDCLESNGKSKPDCIDLNSIRQYLVLSDG